MENYRSNEGGKRLRYISQVVLVRTERKLGKETQPCVCVLLLLVATMMMIFFLEYSRTVRH